MQCLPNERADETWQPASLDDLRGFGVPNETFLGITRYQIAVG